jgi:hypothetical protein
MGTFVVGPVHFAPLIKLWLFETLYPLIHGILSTSVSMPSKEERKSAYHARRNMCNSK